MATRKPAKKPAPAPKKTTTKPAARNKAAGSPARKRAPATKAKKPRRPAAEPAQLGLTDLQQRFVDEYLVDLNGTQAAIRAGYSPDSARQMASENLSKPYIQAAIAEARKAQQERTQVDADRVVTEAWNIVLAEADPAAFASRAVREMQFVYSKTSKMQWGRGAVGGTLMTFKTYSIAYLELLHRMYTQGGPEGKRAALLAPGMLMLMGSSGGLPFAEDAEDVADALAQLLGYNISAKKARQEALEAMLPKGIADFLDKA
jgi:hypothetical protein